VGHCDPQNSDVEPVTVPTTGVTQTWTSTANLYNNSGLGCTVGLAFALCKGMNPTSSLAYDQPYLYALDIATGKPLWNSGTAVNGSVNGSAPLIDANDNSYVSDDNYLVSFDAAGHVRWSVPNPVQHVLMSMNTTADGHLVSQGSHRAQIVVIDPTTGQVTGSLVLTDTINEVPGIFITTNMVSVWGNRLYTLTQFQPNAGGATQFTQGRLYAVDVVNGVPQVAWHWDGFIGPSGASPLTIVDTPYPTIYFDGQGRTVGDPHHPWFFALQDRGSNPALLWAKNYAAVYGTPNTFFAFSAARDPRGGVWEHVGRDSRLLRVDEQTGALLQTIDCAALFGAGYQPSSVMSIAANGGRPIMYQGVINNTTSLEPNYLVAFDLTTGTPLWKIPVGQSMQNNVLDGPFPIGQEGGAEYLVTQRWDGTVFGFGLQ
jgi:outer membrane protein assembly factor BamB